MNNYINNSLITWYLIHKRDLPWRNTSNPYFIWISEIILQQTRVAQGLPYYEKFIEEFSTINLLANAPEERILKVWQGLGYYSRARNMHFAAKQILNTYKGIFPSNYKDILSLKGVGEYTAAAVASMAFNEPVAVVDGNVIRVISRLFAVQEPVDKPTVLKEIKELAAGILAKDKPALHNQAIMEFGALHCVPVNPDCMRCPLAGHCLAYKYKLVSQIPVKQSKVKVRNRFFYYLVIHENEFIYFRKRSSGDIWEGLFEFPLIETSESVSPGALVDLISKEGIVGSAIFEIINYSEPIKHLLTHQKLEVSFIHMKIENLLTSYSEAWVRTKADCIHELAVPRVIERYICSRNFNKIIGSIH